MANYYCSSRTNYFRVKDVAAFRAWAERHGVEVHESAEHPGHFALAPSHSTDDGSFPSCDSEKEEDADFAAELAGHLAADSVAVILEAGAEKLCYITGYAIAINARGQRVEVSLESIYALAARCLGGVPPTRAEY